MSAATAATVANQNAGVDFLEDSTTTDSHDMALTSGDDTEGHIPELKLSIDTSIGLDLNEQAHVSRKIHCRRTADSYEVSGFPDRSTT